MSVGKSVRETMAKRGQNVLYIFCLWMCLNIEKLFPKSKQQFRRKFHN